MRKGIQLYSIRSLAQRDLEKALAYVSDLGYEGVEFAGFGGNTAEDVRRWLEKYKLVAIGTHTPLEDITRHYPEVIAFNKVIGNRRIVIPWTELKTQKDTIELAKMISHIAPIYEEAGMQLYYHNHAQEFIEDNGEYLLDILANNVLPGDLKLELDMYWVYAGGADPVTYLKKYQYRSDIFHAKDGIGEEGTVLGEGAVDLDGVFDFAKANDYEWAIVESEANNDEANQLKAIQIDFDRLCKYMDN